MFSKRLSNNSLPESETDEDVKKEIQLVLQIKAGAQLILSDRCQSDRK